MYIMNTADEAMDHRLEKLLQILPPIDGLYASEVEGLVLALSPDALDNQGRHFAFKHIARLMQVNESRGRNEPEDAFRTPPPAPMQQPPRIESALTPTTPGRSETDASQHVAEVKGFSDSQIKRVSLQAHSGYHALTPPPASLGERKRQQKAARLGISKYPDERGTKAGSSLIAHDHAEDRAATVAAAVSPPPDTWLCFSKLVNGTRKRDLRRNIESAGFRFNDKSLRWHGDHALIKVTTRQADFMISTLHKRNLRYGPLMAEMSVHVADPAACECEENMARPGSGQCGLCAAPSRIVPKSWQGVEHPSLHSTTRPQKGQDLQPEAARFVWLRFDNASQSMRKRNLRRKLQDYLIDVDSIHTHGGLHGFVKMPANEADLIMRTLDMNIRAADPADCSCGEGRGDMWYEQYYHPGAPRDVGKLPARGGRDVLEEKDTRRHDRYAKDRRSRSPQRSRSPRKVEQRTKRIRSVEDADERYDRYRYDRNTTRHQYRRSQSPERPRPLLSWTSRNKSRPEAPLVESLGRIPACSTCHKDGKDCDGKADCSYCQSVGCLKCTYALCDRCATERHPAKDSIAIICMAGPPIVTRIDEYSK